jgi:hypothetical protein
VLSAFLYIEVAALIVRRWRPLRHGEGRARLERVVRPLAFVLVCVQTFFVYRWMIHSVAAYPPSMAGFIPQTPFEWLVALGAPIAGLFFLLWLAELVGRHGLGNGLSVLVAGLAISDGAGPLLKSLTDGGALRDRVGPLLLAALILTGLVLSTARRRDDELPIPTAATMPLAVAAFLTALPSQLLTFTKGAWLTATADVVALGTTSDLVITLGLVATFVWPFAWLLSRPRLLAPFWGERAPALFRRGVWQSLAFLVALAFVKVRCEDAHLALSVLELLVVACVALDVADELRLRLAHADLARVVVEHRLYAVGPALAALASAGIPTCTRARRHRALLSFWGPYLPLEVLVPADRAAEARALLTSSERMLPAP